jgi:hypothetical protein
MANKRARTFICERCQVERGNDQCTIPALANLDEKIIIEMTLPEHCINKDLCRNVVTTKIFEVKYDPMINRTSQSSQT